MDSKDIRNLQEAYIGVYDSDLREEQEFKSWVTELLDEGYDLSDYNWDEMYEIYNEARDPGVKEYQGGPSYSLRKRVRTSNQVKPAGKKPEGETGGVGQVKPDGKDPLDTNKSDYERFSLGLAPNTKKFGRPVGRKYDPAAIRNDAITSQMAKPKPEAPRRRVIKASYEPDIYDVILEYLINEGYADTYEAAESIMVNMSEEWRESIVEVRGGGKIDAVSDIPSIGERGSRSARDAGMLMSPLDRATARVNALKKRGTPEAKKRANQINSRFVNPTKSAVNRSLLAATNARSAEKRRLMQPDADKG